MAKKKNEITIRSSAAEYLMFIAATGNSEQSFEMRYQDENIWLTQKMMSVLYDVDVRTINDHIQKVYADDELSQDSTIRKFRIVQTEEAIAEEAKDSRSFAECLDAWKERRFDARIAYKELGGLAE